jgi:molecular chaperone GrpE
MSDDNATTPASTAASASGSIPEPASEPTPGSAPEPVSGSAAEPVSGSAPEPASGSAPEPASESTSGPTSGSAEEIGPEASVADLQKHIGELHERIADLEDKWHRAAAEVENTRKRVTREIAYGRAEERARLAGKWLPVLDDLDRALQHADADPDTIIAGVEVVRRHALKVLATLGFPRQDVEKGARFDPERNEAVATVATEELPAGAIVDVVRPGYGEPQRQLRPSAVVVAARSDVGDTD